MRKLLLSFAALTAAVLLPAVRQPAASLPNMTRKGRSSRQPKAPKV